MIIGVVGFISSGKNSVANQLVSKYNFKQDSFASSLKDACSIIFDWPRHMLEGDTKESRTWREEVDQWWSSKLNIPNLTPRYALQLLGTDALREHFNQNIWFLTLENRIRKNPNKDVVISDVRFPNEIKFIKENNGVILRVNRGDLPVWYETALLANKGNNIARDIMLNSYASVHSSEWAWIGSDINYELNNNGTVEDLEIQVDDIIKNIK